MREATSFRVLEVDAGTTLLTERLVGSWVDRVPEGHVLDVRTHRLLSQHPAPQESVWPEVRDALSAEVRARRHLYADDLPPDALDQALARFVASVAPLAEFGKLGAIIVPFPSYVQPGPRAADYLAWLRNGCGELPLAVEFRHRAWTASKQRDQTFALLEELRIAFVCVDAPPGFESSVAPLAVATTSLAVVRFHGRDAQAWERGHDTGEDAFDSEYRRADLEPWITRFEKLTSAAREVHALMTTSPRTATRNARLLVRVLTEEPRPKPEPRPTGPPRRRRPR